MCVCVFMFLQVPEYVQVWISLLAVFFYIFYSSFMYLGIDSKWLRRSYKTLSIWTNFRVKAVSAYLRIKSIIISYIYTQTHKTKFV